ncbi:uncharacterized protein LOC136081446 [Hydra vulgaris]|uniref:Uncharacterized protein LOC136081446 n=1 Tax=Hydra vulgaris TaxID=6087 RepID=A0ABM4BZY8_HYDVU
MILGCIYRPSSSDIEAFSEISSAIFHAKTLISTKKYNGIIIAGDFNFPEITWTINSVFSSSKIGLSSSFVSLFQDCHLHQIVTVPTIKPANCPMTKSLDLIICDSSYRASEIKIGSPLGLSDQYHCTITWHYKLASSIKLSRFNSSKLIYKHGNYEKINKEFNNVDWSSIFKDLNVEQCYQLWLNKYNKCCLQFIPRMPNKPSPKKQLWMTKELLSLIRLKKSLWARNFSSKWKITSLVGKYRETRKFVKKLSHSSLKSFEIALANDKRNPKRLFSYINSKRSVINQISSIRITSSSESISSDKITIANSLNNQFQSVFSKEPSNDNLPRFDRRTNTILTSIFFDTLATLMELSALDISKLLGVDNVSPHVLRFCSTSMSSPLTLIFKKSFEQM